MTDFNRTYFGARRTCLEMLMDRGYKIPNQLGLVTEKEFDVMFGKKQMDLTEIEDNEGRPVFVKIIEPTRQFNVAKDRISVFKEAAKYFYSHGLTDVTDEKTLEAALDKGLGRLIIIYNSNQSGQLQVKYAEEYITHPYIEVYQVILMVINPKYGKYQKKWRTVNDKKELIDLYRRYDAKALMFGSCCIDDPMNRYYNGRVGDIYEITRDGTTIYYRKVTSKRMNVK